MLNSPPVRAFCGLLCSLLLLGVVGCGGDNSQTRAETLAAGAQETRAGLSYDVYLESEVDGETIAFTVHEPDMLQVGAGYPLLLHSHGYSGTRTNAEQRATGPESFDGRVLGSGYGILSLDERGHGESGGLIRVLDPDYAGADWLQVLDWVEANLPWVAAPHGPDGEANLLLGAYGGSYGGGFQQLIYRIDPKDRLDVMAPDITWYDLNDSLYPNRVFKTYWGTLLSAGGNVVANGQHPDVNAGLALGLAANQLTAEQQFLLYRNSLAFNCEGNGRPLRPIAALYSQSAIDTLFNFNEAINNVDCVGALGGDVRLMVKPSGHSGGEHSRCGALELDNARFAFFEEHLYNRRGAADAVPKYCFHLDDGGDEAVILDEIPRGANQPQSAAVEVEASNVVLHEAADQLSGPVVMDLGIEVSRPQALVGLPHIQLAVRDPILGLEGLGDPILFAAIGRSSDGGASWEALMDQYQPFRGYGVFTDDLVGVSVSLEPGDRLALLIYPSQTTQYPSSGTLLPTLVNLSASLRIPLVNR